MIPKKRSEARAPALLGVLNLAVGKEHDLYCDGSSKRHAEPAAPAGAAQLQATAHPSCWHIAGVLKHPPLNLSVLRKLWRQ